ncbi:PREDICTED: zinc finger protein 276 [Elephantulus edwardii]|uniref:zinc finger protein 276 n=1 Tax=Elephantulus edwardii TaxID=28737 RepID=UPI0003F0BCC1|nr:PREDICTED: zinc finger protein 276 [Elephantulus edwardii]
MKRDRLGRFLSPGATRQRGGPGGGACGGGRTRGRPVRSGDPSGDGTAVAAAEDGAEEAALLLKLPRSLWTPSYCGPFQAGSASSLELEDSHPESPPAGSGGPAKGDGGPGRLLATGHCRLCHGKFSSRSLRNVASRGPGESVGRAPPGERVLSRDFQHLLGIPILQDPALSPFVCKNCHAQFYQCHSLLSSFLQRVNAAPARHHKPFTKTGTQSHAASEESTCLDQVPWSLRCLQALVRWVHGHATSCATLPSLQRVLSSEYCGGVRAVWGCGQGHDYIMDTDSGCGAPMFDSTLAVKWEWEKETATQLTPNPAGAASQHSPGRGTTAEAETEVLPSTDPAQQPSLDGSSVGPCQNTPPQPSPPLSGSPGQLNEKQVPSSASDDRVKDEFSDLSEGDFLSDDEQDKKQNTPSSDESFEPYPEKRVSSRKSEGKEAKRPEEPKTRKKPGPKPGWKKQLRCEREELPTIYKCPYQGCTAVYRGADGMKKHIKEHHEEVRERPCPHPGCNKVFMIDRYLQRHVKLIHTEVRNYICDECGQTFKQRKHLLVHQMRHSGAKPLQCEVCGFQCRQRASLKYHMTKHKAETELDFACDQCGRRFEKAHNLNVHMSMVHPLTQNQDKARPSETEAPRIPGPLGTRDSQAVKPEPT